MHGGLRDYGIWTVVGEENTVLVVLQKSASEARWAPGGGVLLREVALPRKLLPTQQLGHHLHLTTSVIALNTCMYA